MTITPDDEWADLCREFRVAQAAAIAAVNGAFVNGMMRDGAAQAINDSAAAERAVRARMDAFITRHDGSTK